MPQVSSLNDAKTLVPIPRVWKGEADINVGRVWVSFIGEPGVTLTVNFFGQGGSWRSNPVVLTFDHDQDSVLVDPWEGETVMRVEKSGTGAAGYMVEAVLR